MKNLSLALLLLISISGMAQSTKPQKKTRSTFYFYSANVYFEIDSANGARITSFKVGSNQLLATDNSDNNAAGSTFWPSPQAIWDWPPLVNLDSKPYTTNIVGDTINFAGSTDTQTSLRFYKKMYANTRDTSIVIHYIMKNEMATAQSWAPWEVTRVVGAGLTVFKMGEGSVTGILAPSTTTLNGYVWYDQDKNIVTNTGTYKLNSDGEGWLAHVVSKKYLFIKKFNNIPISSFAPAEAEVQIYTAQDNKYTELENQGAYNSIAGKDSITYTVKWFARVLPTSVSVSVGSTSLVSYIESVLARSEALTSVQETKTKPVVAVYPNPATDALTIESTIETYDNVVLSVYDLHGKQVLQQTVRGANQRVSVKGLENGNYLYEVRNGLTQVGKGKFIINR